MRWEEGPGGHEGHPVSLTQSDQTQKALEGVRRTQCLSQSQNTEGSRGREEHPVSLTETEQTWERIPLLSLFPAFAGTQWSVRKG